ncbi:MAG: hypothetical protein ABSG94_06950 [Brevinematales bacterium]|jgi:hypothetical protein
MRKILISLFLLNACASFSFASIDLSGAIQNDAYLFKTTNNVNFYDELQDKLVFTRQTPDWRFYADLRVYSFYGELPASFSPALPVSNIAISPGVPLNYSFDLLRAFIRYESPAGVWTAGKTYINFGNFGIFNPFDINKTVDLSDLSMDKDGILALQYEAAFSDLSGVKLYVGPQGGVTNSALGGSIFGNIASFDGGIVYNRLGTDTNKAGIYLKGDILVGVNFSYAYHFDDELTNNFSEASAGIDYDFLDGKLQTALTYYYDEKGSLTTNNYRPYGYDDVYFTARQYLFGDLKYTYDEFLSFELYLFLNLEDYSGVIAPSATYTLSDGLDLTLLVSFVTGSGGDEFSDNLYQYALDVRLTAKL